MIQAIAPVSLDFWWHADANVNEERTNLILAAPAENSSQENCHHIQIQAAWPIQPPTVQVKMEKILRLFRDNWEHVGENIRFHLQP